MVTFISLISGSSGNATYISDGKTRLLIDCGMSGTKLKDSLRAVDVLPEDIDAILVTHEHIDHVRGAGVVSRRYNIPVYATEGTHKNMNAGKLAEENIKVISARKSFQIGGIGVTPFTIPHDAAEPVGYTFFAGGEKYALATDIGKMDEDLLGCIKGSKRILLESNHDIEMLRCGTYPYPLKQRILSDTGHLSNNMAAQTALELVNSGTEHIMLGHLSMENNRPEIAMLETYNLLSLSGINVGDDVTLKIADRYKPTIMEV